MKIKPTTRLEKFKNGFLHEKLIFFSLIFVLSVLSFDCWFQNLPLSGYGLVFVTLILIGVTTWATCHGIKWLILRNKPLQFYITQESKDEKWLKFLKIYKEKENIIFDSIFQSDKKCFASFKYPTTLNEQTRLFLKDIEKDFIKSWYSDISQNPSFLFDTHLLLEEILFKILGRLKNVNSKNLILKILVLYLNHLQEFKKGLKKISKLNCDNCEPKLKKGLVDVYRYSHPGSQNDQILNHYLFKIVKYILQEYAPHEFITSLQCKILRGIVARKVFRGLLTTIEDPNWINIKFLYLLNYSEYENLLKNKTYTVKERIVEETVQEQEYKFNAHSMILTKRFRSTNLFPKDMNFFNATKAEAKDNNNVQKTEKESMTLPLKKMEGNSGNISTVLGGLISSTAGPLLPDNMSLCYHPLNKMWQSPVVEVKKDFPDSLFRKTIVEGVKIQHKNKPLSRSKSTDAMSPVDPLKLRDVSIGEELYENALLTEGELVPKRKSSGNVKKLVKTRSFDTGSIAIESITDDIFGGNFDKRSSTSSLTLEGSQTEEKSGENQGDVSPVYEEPEDFATTIAKLRSLLQQRESSSTLSDKSVRSIDSQSAVPSMDRSDSSNKSKDLDNGSFDSQVACDVPSDGRLFMNVCIPKTELSTDSNGCPYVLYSIQYDGIYMIKDQNNQEDEPELILQTTITKRRFQEFLNLHSRLEENNNLKAALRGIKGPSKWLNLPFSGKTDESTTSSRRPVLELYLQQLCSKVEISTTSELHEFLAYGYNGNSTFVKKDSDFSIQRIDKLLANKVTGVFNSIKTALPSFDFETTSSIMTSEAAKGFQEQKLLQGFLNFGNKPAFVELNFDFTFKEPTGDSLTDDIRRYFSEKSDCIEDALDVLDSNDWMSEQGECRPVTADGKCVWHNFKDSLLDDELEQLDSWLPVYSLILDILCELLQDSDSWAVKEPVVYLIKVLSGHWEDRVKDELKKLDWDQILGNVIRLIRLVVFQSSTSEFADLKQEETKKILHDAMLNIMPNFVTQFVKPEGVSSAILLFIGSFQHFRLNRDVLLRLMDIILIHLLSCPHLACES